MSSSTSGVGATGNGWTGSAAATRPVTVPELAEMKTVSSAPVPEAETTGELVDVVAALVMGVPGVVELHPGRFGEVATYLPGRRVAGVKLAGDRVEVHVVLAFGLPIRAVAHEIHAVVAAVVDVPVQVFIEDLAAPNAA